MAFLSALLLLMVAGPAIWGHEARQFNVDEALQGFSGAHPLGTDDLGRDILARVLSAARLSITMAALVTAFGMTLGIALGAMASVAGTHVQRVLGGIINVGVAFPGIVLALFVITIVGRGPTGASVALGVSFAPLFARLAQTLAASVAGSDFVAAARVIGVPRRRLLLRHLLPNMAEPLILTASLSLGSALLSFSALSFLGLGIQPPSFDWGVLLDQGLDRIYVTPAAALGPGVAIILAGLGFNLLGDVLARAFTLEHLSDRGDKGWRRHPIPSTASTPRSPASSSLSDAEPTAPVLRVRGLSVRFPTARGVVEAVTDVNLDVARAETVGIVGESGCGKTMTALAIARLVPRPGQVAAERLEFQGRDLGDASAVEVRHLLATGMPLVFQDPTMSLNPAMRVGRQLSEVAEVHMGMRRRDAARLSARRLGEVRVPAPERRLHQYPHELSGGMRQRTMLAMGLMGEPALILADEPTTALDVTVQQQIIRLLRDVNQTSGVAIMLISHDISVVAALCRRVLVMYAGRIVEDVDVETLLSRPAHPYTRALLAAAPDLEVDRSLPLATIPGRPPDLAALPQGCPFAPRCPSVQDRCRELLPPLEPLGPGHSAACWVAQDEAAAVARSASRGGDGG